MSTVEPNGEIHEAADVFPMLPEDELQELAADIKANGLIHPIVLDDEGVLVDGRNRLAACRIAGVEPTFTSLNGDDPISYILSANVNRRNMSKGQRAMAMALLNYLAARKAADMIDVDQAYIVRARAVLNYARDLAGGVMSGAMPLQVAYEEAKRSKERAKSAESRLAILQTEDPRLATLVVEESLSIDEAWRTWNERVKREEDARRDLTKDTARALVKLWAVLVEGADKIVDEWVEDANTEKDRGDLGHLWTESGLRDLAHSVNEFAAAVDRRGGLH